MLKIIPALLPYPYYSVSGVCIVYSIHNVSVSVESTVSTVFLVSKLSAVPTLSTVSTVFLATIVSTVFVSDVHSVCIVYSVSVNSDVSLQENIVLEDLDKYLNIIFIKYIMTDAYITL